MNRKFILAALFAALTAVLSQMSVPVGPVPITLSVFAVFLSAMLPFQFAFLAQIIYILLGVIGLPVFANFTSGFGALLGPTGGFIMAYPFMATIAAWGNKTKKLGFIILSMVASLLVCYSFGTLWFAGKKSMDILSVLSITVMPFVLVDIGKFAVAAIIINRVQKAL